MEASDKLNELDMLFKEMEAFAIENHVPIIKAAEREIFRDIIKKYQPKRILEIGTAIGYSALVMASCSPKDIQITTLELSEDRASIAKDYINKSIFKDNIQIIIGDAGETLLTLDTEKKYDMVFIDAAKGQYPDYLKKIMPLLTDNAIIVADNVLFRGYVKSEEKPPRRYKTIVKRIREYLDLIENEYGFSTTVYEDGDGLAVSQKIKL